MNRDWYVGALPPGVLAIASTLTEPAFVYDVAGFRQTVTELVAHFDAYAYPVKANPEPAFLKAAQQAGALVDACSPGDLDAALRAGFSGSAISYTSAFLPKELFERLAELGARVDANSVRDAVAWHEATGRPVGVRLQIRGDADYGAKFGVSPEDLKELAHDHPDILLRGLHVHGSHGNLTPADGIRRIGSMLDQVSDAVIAALEYVNTGGGWRVGDDAHDKANTCEYVRALGELRAELLDRGFRGELVVEPGDWAAIDHGWWCARVAGVRKLAHDETGQGAGRTVVILNTNTPMPSRGIPTPLALVRDGSTVSPQEPRVRCDLYGSANNQRDLLGADIQMPAPEMGDVVVFTRCGAYVRSLIASFNERPVPMSIVF